MSDVTIADIARAAGVSPSTVSRALRNHPRISPERCAEIQALAQKAGYRPSQVARSLVTGHTQTLGVVVTDVTDPFVAEVMKGAEAASRAAGYGLLFAMSNRDPEQEIKAAQMLLDRQVEGMIVISGRAAGRYEELIESYERFPLVLVNNDPPRHRGYSVRIDNHAGAMEAVEYLSGLGHRHIAFVEGPPAGRSSRERLAGYLAGLSANGLAPEESFVVPGTGQLEDGPRALERLLALSNPPTAVLCYNDLAAIGLLAAATAANLRLPEHLSVIGFDNIPLSAFTVPSLTSVDQPKARMGELAVAMCLGHLKERSMDNEVLRGHLVIRQSVGTPR